MVDIVIVIVQFGQTREVTNPVVILQGPKVIRAVNPVRGENACWSNEKVDF